VGVNVGWDRLLATAEKFGFGSALPFTLDTAPTQIHDTESKLTKTLLASTAFGQGEILTTPLQMAEVAAAVANGGVIESPQLGYEEMDGDAVVGKLEEPTERRVMSEAVAHTVRDLMVAVVDKGQANGVAIPGVKVAGKT